MALSARHCHTGVSVMLQMEVSCHNVLQMYLETQFPIITSRRHDLTERLLTLALNLILNNQSECPDQSVQLHSQVWNFAVRIQTPRIL